MCRLLGLGIYLFQQSHEDCLKKSPFDLRRLASAPTKPSQISHGNLHQLQ